MNKKGYLQISFAWLFAIIVGAFILFLAIYAVTKISKTEQTVQDLKTSKEIGILLNPLETGFETGKTTALTMPTDTKIYNICNNIGTFGEQRIRTSQKSLNKRTKTDDDVGFSNKYLFSERYVEGKKFYLFSKPFDFPFKVADLIYITSAAEQYCFIDAPEDIEDEISELKQENLLLKDCSDNSIKICFEESNCDIDVDYYGKSVKKERETMYFEGDTLMYAAIFSDKDIYECQLKRLMQRTRQLSLLYKDKADFIPCDSNLNQDLLDFSNFADSLSDSRDLYRVNYIVEIIDDKNEDNWRCKLW